MKLRLPATFQDLTLRHLMTLETETDPVKRVQAVTGHSFAELRKMPHKLIVEANAHLDTLQANEVAQHKEIIELNGVEYGFVPDWDEFSAGEWIDMETYTADFWKTPHKAMSILYRPLERKWGDRYSIKPYTAKEDADVFLDMPAPLVAVLFNSENSGGDEFAEKWGWYPVLYTLAGEDILKMDAVTKLPVGHAFTHLAYLKDLNFKREQASKNRIA